MARPKFRGENFLVGGAKPQNSRTFSPSKVFHCNTVSVKSRGCISCLQNDQQRTATWKRSLTHIQVYYCTYPLGLDIVYWFWFHALWTLYYCVCVCVQTHTVDSALVPRMYSNCCTEQMYCYVCICVQCMVHVMGRFFHCRVGENIKY